MIIYIVHYTCVIISLPLPLSLSLSLSQAADDIRKQQREAEEIERQMEEDTDQEILALKNHYERQLHEQCDENLKLRGDTGILKKKVFKIIISTYMYNYY